MWLEHSNQWPKVKTQNTRLISRPGFWIDSEDQFGSRTIPNKCGNKDHHVFQIVGTSVDMKFGSSGGTILAPDIQQTFGDGIGEYTAQELLGIGVATGAIWDRSKYNHDEWDSAGPVPVEADNGYDGKNANWFTGIVDPTFLRRDDPEKFQTHKDDPKVRERGEHRGCIPCRRYNASDECIELEYEGASRTTTAGNGNVSDKPFQSKGTKEDDERSARPGTTERLVRCKYQADLSPLFINNRPAVLPGMMIGVMGASAKNSRYIGDFQLICAPFSSQSYTKNWRFLHNKGAAPPWYYSLIKGFRGWGNFAQLMHKRFLQKVGAPKGQMVRPVPMKLCPPNYLMNGISVRTDGKGILGVLSLECRKPLNPGTRQNAAGADQISVYLDASESGVDGYTLYGNDYSLDQRVGNPSRNIGSNEKIERFSCENFVLSALEMTHNHRGELVQFVPKCTPYEL